MVQIHPSLLPSILEGGNSNTSKENIYEVFKSNKSNKFDLVSLKSIYLDEFDKYHDRIHGNIEIELPNEEEIIESED